MTDFSRLRPHIIGDGWRGGMLLAGVIGLLLVFSGAFVTELVAIDFSLGWIAVTAGIAIGAGILKAGLLPTVGALWLFAVWWFVFPPLIGYYTGDWDVSTRYTYPRFLGYAYGSAAAELAGGIERGTSSGLVYSLVVGTGGYLVGLAFSRFSTRSDST